MAKDRLHKLADELEQVLDQRAEVEAVLGPIKEREEEIRADLLEAMRKKGYKYVKASSGLGLGVTPGRTTFIVKKGSEQGALEWARKEYPSILSINKPLLANVLGPMLEIPAYFEEKKGAPYLTIRSANDESEEGE